VLVNYFETKEPAFISYLKDNASFVGCKTVYFPEASLGLLLLRTTRTHLELPLPRWKLDWGAIAIPVIHFVSIF
jgi:hypothetical protein